MGSNLSRQSERKDERTEDFAVYDAQNYRRICEKYMLVIIYYILVWAGRQWVLGSLAQSLWFWSPSNF